MNINNSGNYPVKFIITIIMLLCISLHFTTSAASVLFKIGEFVLYEENESQMPSLLPLVYESNLTIAVETEFELNWSKYVTGSAELLYYIPDTKLRPYLGIGAGVETITLTLDTTGDSSSGDLVFQGIAGIRYQFSEKIGIFGELKQTAGPSDTVASGVASVGIVPDINGSVIFVGVSLNLW